MSEFDVFLCHNSQDKPEVIKIAQELQKRELKPWLDEWHLQPGLPWQRELERQITNIRAAAVFIGKSGFGPWQRMEIEAYLRRFVNQGSPVIPVLLDNAPKQPELPIFLEGMTWVDFRHSESNPMNRLIWGITGIRPADFDTRLEAQAQSFTQDLGNRINLEMIAIPDGTFMMGSPEDEKGGYGYERPQHKVTVQPFFMGKYPITQAQWKAIADREDLKVERDLDLNPAYFKDRENSARRPVESVDWDDAVEFCQRLSKQTGTEYRLPTEAEWEYACRAGTTTPYYFGENITDKLANYNSNVGETTSVGQFPPNAFGLYDMHGNVWEWCQDDWHDSYKNAPNDGSAWVSETSSTKVTRGGSWGINPDFCRSATRNTTARDDRSYFIGFRVVCVVPRTT